MSSRVEDNVPLVRQVIDVHFTHYVAREVNHKFQVEYEDLHSTGLIGLMKADKSFNTERHTEFQTYAYHCIRGEIRHFIRDNNAGAHFAVSTKTLAARLPHSQVLTVDQISEKFKVKKARAIEVYDFVNRSKVSLNNQVPLKKGCDDYSPTFQDLLPSRVNVERYVLRKLELEEKLSYLPDRHRLICEWFLGGDSQTEISRRIGMSQSRISKILKESLVVMNSYPNQ